MIVEIKKPITKAKLKKAEQLLKRKSKGFDAEKYAGKIKWGADAISIQREMRDEWN
jgi:hypothetical protein